MIFITLLFTIVSVLVLFSNFLDIPSLFYTVIYPIIGVLFSIRFFFYVMFIKKQLDVEVYQNQVEKQHNVSNQTKQRVADDVTKIKFPKGYKEKQKLDLDNTKIEFPKDSE